MSYCRLPVATGMVPARCQPLAWAQLTVAVRLMMLHSMSPPRVTDHTAGLCIAALLPNPLQVWLLAAVETLSGTKILSATTGPHLLRLLGTDAVSLVVIDPMGAGQTWRASVSTLLHRKPRVPLIVYTAIVTALGGRDCARWS